MTRLALLLAAAALVVPARASAKSLVKATVRGPSGCRILTDKGSSRPSPWTDGTSELMFSKSTSLIEVDYEHQRIPEAIADDIAAGRTLREEPGRSVPWGLPALAGVGVVAAVSLVRILPFKS